MTQRDDRDIPLRRLNIDRMISDANGVSLPDDDAFDDHIVSLLDEAEQIIPWITFERRKDGEAARITFRERGPLVTYDPAAGLPSDAVDARWFRTVALLHEVMHAACDQDYVKPPTGNRGLNLHIPADLTTEEEMSESATTQWAFILTNYERAEGVLNRDRSKVIDTSMRAYLSERFVYGQAMPDVHNDPVLFEVLVYMAMKKAQDTPTFKYLWKLSTEAADRRAERPPRAPVAVAV